MLEIRPLDFSDGGNSGFEDENGQMSIAERTLKALNTMNLKLQKEIFNYLGLKLRLAFAKNGIGIGKDHSSNLMSQESAEEFFKDIEHKISKEVELRVRNTGGVTFSNEKVNDCFT